VQVFMEGRGGNLYAIVQESKTFLSFVADSYAKPCAVVAWSVVEVLRVSLKVWFKCLVRR